MSDQERLMSSLKKEVRSLLTAVQGGLTPAKLEQEYQSMIGQRLPFRELGYRSTMELVVDMPDVVYICHGADGSVVLKAVANESTKGIASLVARQKSKPNSYFPRLRSKFSPGYASRRGLSCPAQMPQNLPRRGHVSPTLPAVVKSQLKELLRSSPVLLSDFNKTFAQHFGRTFEFVHYGFFSMSEVLNAASDIITVVQTRAGSLLTLKKSPSHNKKPEKLPESKVENQLNDVKQTMPPTGPASTVDTFSPALNLPTWNQDQTPSQESNTSIVQLKPEEHPVLKYDKMRQLQKQMKIALAQRGLGGTVSPKLKEKIKMIAAQHPEGLLVSRLPNEFEAHFKETLPVRDLGFLTLMELVGALSDVLHIECKEGEQDWRIFDMDSQCLADDEENNQNISLSDSLAHEEIFNKDELPCWDFPLEGSKNLEDKFTVVTKMEKRHFGLEEPHIMQEIMKDEIPPDAVQNRSLYRLPQLNRGAVEPLYVEYVVSPSQFYVQIFGDETYDKLQDMMIEMRRCYGSKNVADRYVIPKASVKPGHLCCVKNLEVKWWYRGIIHRVLSDQEVEVFCLDYGNMVIVPNSHLRLLKDCYANLPAQAIPCSLAQSKPAMGDWTSGAILTFQRLCSLKLLVGVVDEYIDGVLYLYLCDTSTEEDIYFHNVLRTENHAVISSKNIPSKGFRELNPSTLYLMPSLEEEVGLEKGFRGSNPSTLYLESSPKEQVGLENTDSSFFQQELPEGLPETTHSEPCEEKVHFQDTSSLSSVLEMPYLEPVYLGPEIWDEDWKFLLSVEEEVKEDTCDNSSSGITVFCSQTQRDKGSNNEVLKNQEVELQTTDSLGSSTDSLSQAREEFYITIVHSQQSAEPSQITMDANKSLACKFQPLPELPAFPVDNCNEEAPSQKKVDDASSNQIIALRTPSYCSVPRELGQSTWVFTAGLQRSPIFHIPYSPSAALGASARLAVSGGYFSLSQRQVNQ